MHGLTGKKILSIFLQFLFIYNFTQKKLVSKFNFYLFIIYNSNHVICVKLTLICTLLNLKIYRIKEIIDERYNK